MPAVITHHLSGKKSLKISRENIQKIAFKYPEVFSLGTQGPDFLFFYPKGKKYPITGILMHKSNIRKFFKEAFSYSKKQSSEDKEILTSYLMGFVSHYAVDTSAHPYIFYHSGFANSKGDLKSPYNAYHRLLEATVDVLLCEYWEHTSFEELHIETKIRPNMKQIEIIAKLYAHVLPIVYGNQFTEKSLTKALKSISAVYRKFHGRKKLITHLMGKPFGNMVHTKDTPFSMEILLEPKKHYLPWIKEELPPLSLMDFLNKGITLGKDYFEIVYDYLYNDSDRINQLGNRSFDTNSEVPLDFLYYDDNFITTYLK